MRMERNGHHATFYPTQTSNSPIAGLGDIEDQVANTDLVVDINFSEVELVHSFELSQLVELHRWSNSHGKKLSLSHMSASNRKLLKITPLDQLFSVAA